MNIIKQKINAIGFKIYKRNKLLWTTISFVWWRVVLFYPWLNPKLYQQAKRLGKEITNSAHKEGKILFLTTRQELEHILWYSVIALALKARGKNSVFIRCDGSLINSCNSGTYPQLLFTECAKCKKCAHEIYKNLGFFNEPLGKYILQSDWQEAKELLARENAANYEKFIYKALPLGQMVKTSVVGFLKSSELTGQAGHNEVYKKFLIGGIVMVNACSRIIAKEKPEKIIMLNGWFMAERIMMETAKRMSIKTDIIEVGYLPGSIFLAHDRPVDIDGTEYWPKYKGRSLDEKEEQLILKYVEQRRNNQLSVINYWDKSEDSQNNIIESLSIDKNKKIAVLFPNIFWDSALYNSEIGFKNMFDWVEATIDYYIDRPDVQLLIRAHPAEVILPGALRDTVSKRIASKYGKLPGNIKLIESDNPISSYVLMDISDYGLVYTSTTAIEMALLNKPVLCCGKVHYRGKGFTIDIEDCNQYHKTMDLLNSNSLKRDKNMEYEYVKRYSNFWLYRIMIPFPFVKLGKKGVLSEFGINSINELSEGVNENMDIICQGILKGTPFIADTEITGINKGIS